MYEVNVKDRNYLTNQMIFYSWLENIKNYHNIKRYESKKFKI